MFRHIDKLNIKSSSRRRLQLKADSAGHLKSRLVSECIRRSFLSPALILEYILVDAVAFETNTRRRIRTIHIVRSSYFSPHFIDLCN